MDFILICLALIYLSVKQVKRQQYNSIGGSQGFTKL